MRRALFVVALVAACRGHDRAPTRPADAGPIAPSTTGPAVRSLEPPTRAPAHRTPMPRLVREELLSAGRGPRQRLRYRLAPTPSQVVATATVTSRGYDGAWQEPLTLAPVRDGFEVTPTADGPLHLRALTAELDRAGQSAAAITAAEGYLTRWRSLLERRRADLTVDARGLLGAVTLLTEPATAGAGDVEDELVQRWLGLAVPLPEAAIGPGARWRVVHILRAGGARLTQTATYTLAGRERDPAGERWRIEVELERIGETQRLGDVILPGDTVAELVALVRRVTGTVTITPSSPLPVAGTLAAEVRSHARLLSPGQPPRDQYSEDTATVVLGGPAAAPAP